MPRLQAAVPANAPPNALLRVRLPDGSEVNVRVPDGLKPGDEFIFEVSSMGDLQNNKHSKRGGSSGTVGGGGVEIKRSEKSASSTAGSSSKKRHTSSKNPKKKASNDSSSRESSNSSSNCNSFVENFFRVYNQIFEAFTQDSSPTSRHSNQRTNTNNKYQSNDGNQIHSGLCSTHRLLLHKATGYHGFLDREIVNSKDFTVALGVGIFIGMSIVLGFLAGVLAVTPIPPKQM